MKWRATFEAEYYDGTVGEWFKPAAIPQVNRIIQKDIFDDAVIYANALVGEEIHHTPFCRTRLGRLMFIEIAEDGADLNQNCANLRVSQERAERIFRERSGQDVIEAMKRFGALGF